MLPAAPQPPRAGRPARPADPHPRDDQRRRSSTSRRRSTSTTATTSAARCSARPARSRSRESNAVVVKREGRFARPGAGRLARAVRARLRHRAPGVDRRGRRRDVDRPQLVGRLRGDGRRPMPASRRSTTGNRVTVVAARTAGHLPLTGVRHGEDRARPGHVPRRPVRRRRDPQGRRPRLPSTSNCPLAPTSSSGTATQADAAAIAEVEAACKETGVTLNSLVPVFNWSSPDEQERQAQVRNWKRLLQIAADLECRADQLRTLRRPHRPAALRARLLPVDGGAGSRVRTARHRAQPRGPPVRLRRAQRRRRPDHPRARPALGQLRLLRAARLPPLRRRRRRGPDDALRRQRGCSTCTSPTATTTAPTRATATSSTRPASTPGSTNTTRSATATSRGTSSSTALREQSFDGIATVCVFGWEEDADDIHRRMLDRITSELAS